MTQLEKDIEKKLRQKIEARGGRCLKWVCPGWAGVPDRIILLPGARVYFIETKRPKGGTLSALQRKWREWLTALGFYYGVVWNWDDLAAFLDYVNRALTPKAERYCKDCEYFDTRSIDEPCKDCTNCILWEPTRKEKHHETD